MSFITTPLKDEKIESKYDQYNSLKNIYGRNMDEPKINEKPSGDSKTFVSESLISFLRRAGFKSFEGGSKFEHFTIFKNILDSISVSGQKQINILEIGCNTGSSCEFFLSYSKNTKVYSFDIGLHAYVGYVKYYLDLKYPNRMNLTIGDSTKTIPTFGQMFLDFNLPLPIMNLIFIDGGHTSQISERDIINCKNFAGPNTMVIVDNVAPHRGCGLKVYNNYKRFVQEGFLNHLNYLEIGDFNDAMAICKYTFKGEKLKESKEEKEKDKESITFKEKNKLFNTDVIFTFDAKKIERRLLSTNETRLMEKSKTIEDLNNHYKKAKDYDNEYSGIYGADSFIDTTYQKRLKELCIS
jgi:hypothetical protein